MEPVGPAQIWQCNRRPVAADNGRTDRDWHVDCDVDEPWVQPTKHIMEYSSHNCHFSGDTWESALAVSVCTTTALCGNHTGHLAVLLKSITSQTIAAAAWVTLQNGSHMSSRSKETSCKIAVRISDAWEDNTADSSFFFFCQLDYIFFFFWVSRRAQNLKLGVWSRLQCANLRINIGLDME